MCNHPGTFRGSKCTRCGRIAGVSIPVDTTIKNVEQLIESLSKFDPKSKVESGYGVLWIRGLPKGDTTQVDVISLVHSEYE